MLNTIITNENEGFNFEISVDIKYGFTEKPTNIYRFLELFPNSKIQPTYISKKDGSVKEKVVLDIIAQEMQLRYISMRQLAKLTTKGYSFCPAVFNQYKEYDSTTNKYIRFERTNKNFLRTEVLALDFDNGCSPESVFEFFTSKGLEPNLIYSSFSDSPQKRKFRLIWVLDEAIKSGDEYRTLYTKMLRFLVENNFSEESLDMKGDEATKDPARLFYGGKELLHFNDKSKTSLKDINNLLKDVVIERFEKKVKNIEKNTDKKIKTINEKVFDKNSSEYSFEKSVKRLNSLIKKNEDEKIYDFSNGYAENKLPIGFGLCDLFGNDFSSISDYFHRILKSGLQNPDTYDFYKNDNHISNFYNGFQSKISNGITFGSVLHLFKSKGIVIEKEEVSSKVNFKEENVKISEINLKDNQYISDLNIPFDENNFYLIARTGSGKTKAVADFKGKKILVVPQQSLVAQIEKEYNATPFFEKSKKISDFIVTTYNSFVKLSDMLAVTKSDYTVFYDECHQIITEPYAGSVHTKNVKILEQNLYKNYVLITGTPLKNKLDIFKNAEILQINKKENIKYDLQILKYEDNLLNSILGGIKASTSNKSLPVIFLNDKNEDGLLGSILAVLNNDGLNYVLINADKKENEDYNEIVINGKVDKKVDVIITTSILSGGISITESNKNIDFYVIGSLHPVKIKQTCARFRKAESISVKIFDKIKEVHEEKNFNIDVIREKKYKILKNYVNFLNDNFSDDSELNFSDFKVFESFDKSEITFDNENKNVFINEIYVENSIFTSEESKCYIDKNYTKKYFSDVFNFTILDDCLGKIDLNDNKDVIENYKNTKKLEKKEILSNVMVQVEKILTADTLDKMDFDELIDIAKDNKDYKSIKQNNLYIDVLHKFKVIKNLVNCTSAEAIELYKEHITILDSSDNKYNLFLSRVVTDKSLKNHSTTKSGAIGFMRLVKEKMTLRAKSKKKLYLKEIYAFIDKIYQDFFKFNVEESEDKKEKRARKILYTLFNVEVVGRNENRYFVLSDLFCKDYTYIKKETKKTVVKQTKNELEEMILEFLSN